MNCKECFSGVLEPIAYFSGCFSLHFSPYVFSEHIQIFICDACGSFYVKAPPGFASKIKEMCRIQNFSERGESMREEMEKVRKKLYQLAILKGIQDPQVIQLSQELDRFIQKIQKKADLSGEQISHAAKK